MEHCIASSALDSTENVGQGRIELSLTNTLAYYACGSKEGFIAVTTEAIKNNIAVNYHVNFNPTFSEVKAPFKITAVFGIVSMLW